MDLGTAQLFDLTAPAAEADEAAAVSRSDELLTEIRERRMVIAEQEIATVRAIAEWATHHVVADEAAASTLTERGLDTGLPVAGHGAPLISDFAVMELSALLGRSLNSGRNYVGQVVELGHRLPKTWARVLVGEVPVWKGLRIADSTRLLPPEAASFVDAQLAPFVHGCTWAQERPSVPSARRTGTHWLPALTGSVGPGSVSEAVDPVVDPAVDGASSRLAQPVPSSSRVARRAIRRTPRR